MVAGALHGQKEQLLSIGNVLASSSLEELLHHGRHQAPRVGGHRALPSSFFVDCSAGGDGYPEGLDAPVLAPENGSQSHHKECAHIRRALERKEHKTWLLFPTDCPEEVWLHYVDGNSWERCCVYGAEGEEYAHCKPYSILLPGMPPPKPPPPPGGNKTAKMSMGLVYMGKLIWNSLCGLSPCGNTGEYPEPMCLWSGSFLSKSCVRQGLPGELYPRAPIGGRQDYKVYQFLAAALPMSPEDLWPALETAQVLSGRPRARREAGQWHRTARGGFL